jgi:hypothetical protein
MSGSNLAARFFDFNNALFNHPHDLCLAWPSFSYAKVIDPLPFLRCHTDTHPGRRGRLWTVCHFITFLRYFDVVPY